MWQQSHAIKDLSVLRQKVSWLPEGLEQTNRHFQFQITPYYLSLLNLKDASDPLAQICLPSLQELKWSEDELSDPIGDRVNNSEMQHSPTPAIVHRYSDRCLLFLTPLCSSYCRYCFRREIVAKPENTFSLDVLEKSFAYIENTKSLREVILSGGDPLLWSDSKLAGVLQRLEQVPHLRTLRIHTRFPVFNPFRITDEFVKILKGLKKPVVLMLHIMHPREMTIEFKEALCKLRESGVMLLNQSVLLKGCNDQAETLRELSYQLSENGVVPQYLHMLDRARGTSHFRVPLERAQQLMQELHGQLSGYMIPQLTLEIPGGFGKISVQSSMIQKTYDEKGEVVYELSSPHLPQKKIFYKESP